MAKQKDFTSNLPRLTIQAGAEGHYLPTNKPNLSKRNTGKKKMSAEEYLARMADKQEEEGEEEGSGKIVTILRLHRAGYSRAEIVAAGFNRSTVYRQVGDYEKLRKAPATSYMGFELYEARVQRVMKKKNISREKAIEFITEQDINND
jgi:hypothetical protein